jgi:hypothetical protein
MRRQRDANGGAIELPTPVRAELCWPQPLSRRVSGVDSLGLIRSQLNNLYLDLVIDEAREIAYKRPVRSEDRTFRTLLHDTSYNREETLLLVFLREQFRAEGAAGATHVFVDADAMQEYVARFRPAHDTDELGGRRKVENAIKALKRAKLITAAPGSDDRYQISRAIETLLPIEKLHMLLHSLRAQNNHGAAAETKDSDVEPETDAEAEADAENGRRGCDEDPRHHELHSTGVPHRCQPRGIGGR